MTDKISKKHDILYSLAQGTNDIRKADVGMVEKLKDMKNKGIGNKINVNAALKGIQFKILGERSKVLKRGSFGRFREVNPVDRELLEGNLEQLEQEGFGQETYPGQELKKKLLRDMNRSVRPSSLVNLIIKKVIPPILKEERRKGRTIRVKIDKKVRKKLISRLKKKKKTMKGEGIGTILGSLALSASAVLLPELIKLISKGIRKAKARRKLRGKGKRRKNVLRLKKLIESVFNDPSIIGDKKLMRGLINGIL